ncbi:GNAT family N-acetyltransferase [Peribacillus saganii]|uniref:GNAT family N-acetyltransferase n=1 Tax=Peribacillus saganii TaxID=2303992 RepID=UPI0013144AAC|nr:GNAT family N-acetyltransferase [Peribacillus saganii]
MYTYEKEPREGLYIKDTCKYAKVEEIRQLAQICNNHDHIKMELPLNIPLLLDRPSGEYNSFLYYKKSILVGFLGMFSFVKEDEVELTGMVHPSFRMQGIFTMMFEAAKKECLKRGTVKIFGVNDHFSESGKRWIKAAGGTLSFSEASLELRPDSIQRPYLPSPIQLISPGEDDMEILKEIFMASFGDLEDHAFQLIRRNIKGPEHSLFLAMHGKEAVGTITATQEIDSITLTAFAVHPNYQRKGYGRQILLLMVEMLIKQGQKNIRIEAETTNTHALKLYENCGFVIDSCFDYYQLR